MVLLHSKVPDEVGSSPSMTTCDLTPVSFWLGLFAVPVLPSACHTCPCHGDVCCTVLVCHWVSLECPILVLCGFHVSFSKGQALFLSLQDSRHWPTHCIQGSHQHQCLVMLHCSGTVPFGVCKAPGRPKAPNASRCYYHINILLS